MRKPVWLLGLLTMALVVLGTLLYLRQGNLADQETSPSSSSQLISSDSSQAAKVLPAETIVKQELSVPRDSYRIYGQLTAPQGYEQKSLPLVIIAHGFGNTSDFLEPYAEILAKAGYLVYTFDFVGGSHASRSGGSMTEMSVFTEQADLEAVLAQLSQQSYVDSKNVFLAGYSQGGVVATLVAAAHNSRVKGLITMNAAFVLFDDARRLFPSQEAIPDIYNHRGTELGRVYFEKLLDFDIYDSMRQYDQKTLIIQGTADEIVPLSYAERAAQTFPQAELLKLEGAGHILNEKEQAQALLKSLAYLQERLAEKN